MSGPLDLLDPPDLRGLLVFREFRGRTFQFSSIQWMAPAQVLMTLL